MRRIRVLGSVWALALVLTACGGEGEAEIGTTEAVETSATQATSTETTEAPTTTTTTTTTTITITTTTTTEPEDGEDWGVVVGDCYINTDSGEEARSKVPCDEPHDGEVFAIIRAKGSVGSDGLGRPPDPDAVRAEILGHLSDYVGVETASVLDWLPEQGITARLTQRATFDKSGVVSTETFCSLIAEEGDLARSFRSD